MTVVALMEVGDLGEVPVVTTLDGHEVVVWRRADGGIGVVPRACPHLDWDLAEARPVADTLVCPGHGWSIASDGRVFKRNEFGREDHKGTVEHWPATERDAKIWVEVGTEERRPTPGPGT